jgi:DNA-binding MarR family transcriptional regulator
MASLCDLHVWPRRSANPLNSLAKLRPGWLRFDPTPGTMRQPPLENCGDTLAMPKGKGEAAAARTRKPGAGKTAAGNGNAARRGMLPNLLGYQLRRAQIAVFQNFARAMADFDMTPGRFGVLEVIAANGGLSQSELGAILGIDRSTVVAVIDRLEADGLVRRMNAPNDRRSHALQLSEKGAVTLAILEKRVAAHERDIASALNAAERKTLLSLLTRVAGGS